MNPLTDIITQCNTRIDALRKSLDRDARGRSRAETLKEYGPTGKWRFAPAAEKERAKKAVIEEQERAAGLAMYDLGRFRRDHEGIVADVVATMRRPPNPEQAWSKRNNGRVGLSAAELLNLSVLDELRLARIEPTLKNATPSQWMATYERAVEDATEQGNATTIRVLESLLDESPTAWCGATFDPVKQPAEASALLRLRQRVDAVRDARVPADVRTAEAALTLARKVENEAENLHQLRPLNPAQFPNTPATT